MSAGSSTLHPGAARAHAIGQLWSRAISRRQAKQVSEAPARLVVVGNGMVGHRFCERMVELGGSRRFEMVVIGEESLPAYDRVHLTDVLRGRPKEELVLHDASWYREHGIELRLKERVERIERDERAVVTESGASLAYDFLVLATGSRAVTPELPAEPGAEVMPYRTIEDAERILRSLNGARESRTIAVMGGGLLGLEAARVLQSLGCQVVVLEAASQLLPRQLDPDAAEVLREVLTRAGLELKLRTRMERLTKSANAIRVTLMDGAAIEVDAVVAAVGARACDELGQRAGLRCDLRGGIAVDSELKSSDPAIYAIGECANHARVPHGLVAPGYAMADLLARNLTARKRKLDAQYAVTRLKLDLTEVTVLGNPLQAQADRELVHRAEGVYRRLLVSKRRVVAAVCIGAWQELAPLQRFVEQGKRVERKKLDDFERTGSLGFQQVKLSVVSWQDTAVVCQCANVSCGVLRANVAKGLNTAEALGRATFAGTLCGSCRPLLAELCGAGAEAAAGASRSKLWVVAAAALLLSVVTVAVPRIELPDSLAAWSLHILWVDSTFKQVSGFTLLALILLGLTLSLRKRVRRFNLGNYASWRMLHAVLGALGLFALFAHTGFRLGQNLNFALAVAFLASAATGALAGFAAAPGAPASGASSVALISKVCRRLHDYVFWLLPPLLVFHVLKTYYY